MFFLTFLTTSINLFSILLIEHVLSCLSLLLNYCLSIALGLSPRCGLGGSFLKCVLFYFLDSRSLVFLDSYIIPHPPPIFRSKSWIWPWRLKNPSPAPWSLLKSNFPGKIVLMAQSLCFLTSHVLDFCIID